EQPARHPHGWEGSLLLARRSPRGSAAGAHGGSTVHRATRAVLSGPLRRSRIGTDAHAETAAGTSDNPEWPRTAPLNNVIRRCRSPRLLQLDSPSPPGWPVGR